MEIIPFAFRWCWVLVLLGGVLPLRTQSARGIGACLSRGIDTTDVHKPDFLPVRYLRGPLPVYPRERKERGLNAQVLLRFIVGCDGRAEPGSMIVLDATDSAFVAPSITAIVGTQFRAASINGEPVRQLVDQAVRFSLSGGPSVISSQQPWWVSRTPRP